jgi:preprotein translocase subunit SecD
VLVADSNVPVVDSLLARPEVARLVPPGLELKWSSQSTNAGGKPYRALYALTKRPIITGDELQEATAANDPETNAAEVQFELTRTGGRRFGEATSRNIGNHLAILLDGRVHSAPVITTRIDTRGRIEMRGSALEEASDLALVLRAGALPAPIRIMDQRSVGPALGQDSVDKGKMAGLIGIALVLVIMVAIYRVAGFLAIMALVVYVLMVLGGLAALPDAALTAPGIAGLILSIGMALDANFLIFERIREEMDAGHSNRAAMEDGFRNAMSAIVDSNLTTMITALILYQVGTGPVRGFAVTLTIGILASFFSAVFVTKTFFMLYLDRKAPGEPISI